MKKIEGVAEPAGIRVIGGLGAGTRVVTAGIHSLKPGQHVRIEQDQKP